MKNRERYYYKEEGDSTFHFNVAFFLARTVSEYINELENEPKSFCISFQVQHFLLKTLCNRHYLVVLYVCIQLLSFRICSYASSPLHLFACTFKPTTTATTE